MALWALSIILGVEGLRALRGLVVVVVSEPRRFDEGGSGCVGLASPAPLIIHRNGENYSIGHVLCVSS